MGGGRGLCAQEVQGQSVGRVIRIYLDHQAGLCQVLNVEK